ncbi:MAG: DUF3352 domain-containing protein [Thermoleophilaceae bacterium]
MSRFAATLAAACLAIVGCGGSDADSPLDEALGYLPEDAPLALIVSTDLEGDQAQAAEETARDLPFGPILLQQLQQRFEGGDVDFEEDIEPLLGNEAVVGIADPRSLLADDVEGFVAALQTDDADKLEDLAQKGTEEAGEAEGATLYRDDGTFIAVNDDVLVLSDSEEQLRAALEQRGEDDRLREDDVEDAFDDLPDDAAARIYGNVGALLESDPATATARRVPFVDALETFAATATIEDGSVAIDFALNTGDGELGEEQLPIASGDEAPPVIGQEGEIGAGIRDPAQIVSFAEAVAQAVSPEGFAQFETAKRQIAQGLDVDLDRDLVGQFTGDTSVAIDLEGNFAVRSELANPQAFERTLERLVRVIPSFAEGAGLGEVGVARPRSGEDFYAVAGEGGEGIVYGVVDDVFVLANDSRRAADLASEQPQQVEGAEGAVVVRLDAGRLAEMLLSELGGIAGALDIDLPPALLTGSIAGGDGGLRGRFTLDLQL